MTERTGEAFEEGVLLTVVGAQLKVGDRAPELHDLEPALKLADLQGKTVLLNVINSIDTPVCECETRRWDELLGEDVTVYTVSMDLPFAMQRWGVKHPLSAHRSERFGQDYGVLLKEWRLLQRAVFVIDATGVLRHVEYVADQMREPNYDAAVKAAR